METTKIKIAKLRELISRSGFSAYIIPNNDEFGNEYLPHSAKRLEFLTGFSGSAGTAVIGLKKAAFFTDGRYILQAKSQLDSKIFEVYNISEKSPQIWVSENKLKCGFDPWLFSATAAKKFPANYQLSTTNLVDKLWQARPAAPCATVRTLPLKYTGEKWQDKTSRLAKNLNADIALITSPDSVNWLFNIRGGDISHTPFCLAFAALRKKGKPVLFIDTKKLTPEIKKYLAGVEIKNLEPAEIKKVTNGKKLLIDPAHIPFALYEALSKTSKIVEGQDICALPKAIKNKTEIACIKKAHALDGKAVTKFLKWLTTYDLRLTTLNELSVADKLESFRKENPAYQQPSFDTICGFAGNGAIVHYRSTAKTNKKFSGGNLLLVDSGGQYLGGAACGTTDITRTIAIGTPTAEMKHNYTLVLRGHIALATAIFPHGTSGAQLDALARQFLWAEGKDYDHGTGHGVGCYLSVHEGPQGISRRYSDIPLQPGMVLSNEPGYYKAGAYGIRIENLVLVVEKGKYLGFETLTHAPLDKNLIAWEVLTESEKHWINSYHEKIS